MIFNFCLSYQPCDGHQYSFGKLIIWRTSGNASYSNPSYATSVLCFILRYPSTAFGFSIWMYESLFRIFRAPYTKHSGAVTTDTRFGTTTSLLLPNPCACQSFAIVDFHLQRRVHTSGERHCMYGTSSQVKVLLMYAFSQTSFMLLKACTLTSIAGLSPKLVYLTHRTTFAELNIIPI